MLSRRHREVETLFDRFEAASDNAGNGSIAAKICLALKVQMSAKVRIAQIEAMAPGHPLVGAKVKVLSVQISHHVAEEENDLFPESRKAEMDLESIGADLAVRKAELMQIFSPKH